MAEYVDFHYTPLEGRITGKQVLKQTEDAINDLGNRVYNAEVTSEDVQEALDNSQQAIDIANDALAAVTTDKAVWFNNVADMKAANLVNGNVAATKGYTLYNDGNGAFYAIRQKKGGDVDDGVNIIFLDNVSVAERINEFNLIAKKNIIYVVNVAELKASDGKIGSVYGTLGYYTANDGGAGIYTIRAMTASDVEDNISTIFLDNGNVAELIESAEIYNEESIKWALNNNPKKQFHGCVITINNPIDISAYKNYSPQITFTDCTFVLNSNMLTWAINYTSIPRFVNCVFHGNGNAIVDDNLYTSTSFFLNCLFDNVAFSKHGIFCQSARFIGCRFFGETDFITTNAVYDATFAECQGESEFTGKLVVTEPGGTYGGVTLLRLVDCIFEGRGDFSSKELLTLRQGTVVVENCYFELLNGGLMTMTLSSDANKRAMLLEIKNCKLSWTCENRAFVELNNADIAANYSSASRCQIEIARCSFDTSGTNQNILSRYDLPNTLIHGSMFFSGKFRFGFEDTIKRVSVSNVATWETGQIRLKPLTGGAYLIVWNYSGQAWRLNMAICGVAHNVPYALSVIDGTVYTVTVDSDTGEWIVAGINASSATTRLVMPIGQVMLNTCKYYMNEKN